MASVIFNINYSIFSLLLMGIILSAFSVNAQDSKTDQPYAVSEPIIEKSVNFQDDVVEPFPSTNSTSDMVTVGESIQTKAGEAKVGMDANPAIIIKEEDQDIEEQESDSIEPD